MTARNLDALSLSTGAVTRPLAPEVACSPLRGALCDTLSGSCALKREQRAQAEAKERAEDVTASVGKAKEENRGGERRGAQKRRPCFVLDLSLLTSTTKNKKPLQNKQR